MENPNPRAVPFIQKYRLHHFRDPVPSPVLLTGLAADTSFLDYLKTDINKDYTMEKFLVKLRRCLLSTVVSGKPYSQEVIELAAAVACQCFNNEYIFYDTRREQQLLRRLQKRFSTPLTPPQFKTLQVELTALAMYRPLQTLPWAQTLQEVSADMFSPAVAACLRRIFYQPLAVSDLKAAIPSIAPVTRTESEHIRRQYEENPYPRWLRFPRRFKAMAQKLTQGFPGTTFPWLTHPEKRTILVPGCGTGLHPLVLAASDPGAEIVAVDLSRASLAYATHMAGKLGIKNVTFIQGDLLDIPRMGRKFYHIDCVGVLHHRQERLRAWQVLEQVLVPGGTMHIGVYSTVARLQVASLRKEIASMNLKPTSREMKSFRRLLLTRRRYNAIIEQFKDSGDFYALSTLRDMLFHVCEYGYTLNELASLIKKIHMDFLGFRLKYDEIKKEYVRRFPGDPELRQFKNWQQFERFYTGTGLMFLFWLQKPLDHR